MTLPRNCRASLEKPGHLSRFHLAHPWAPARSCPRGDDVTQADLGRLTCQSPVLPRAGASSSVLAQKELLRLLGGLVLFAELRAPGNWKGRAGGRGCRRNGSCLVDLGADRQGPWGALSLGSIFRARALEGAAGHGDRSPWTHRVGGGGEGCVGRGCPGAGASHIITQEACSRRCSTLLEGR